MTSSAFQKGLYCQYLNRGSVYRKNGCLYEANPFVNLALDCIHCAALGERARKTRVRRRLRRAGEFERQHGKQHTHSYIALPRESGWAHYTRPGAHSQEIINSGSKYFLSTLTPPKPRSARRAGYLDKPREYWQRAPHLYWCVVSAWVRGISACDFSSGRQASRPAVESQVS